MKDFFERFEEKKRNEAKEKQTEDAILYEAKAFHSANPISTVQQWEVEIRRIFKKVYGTRLGDDPKIKEKLRGLATRAADGFNAVTLARLAAKVLPYAKAGIEKYKVSKAGTEARWGNIDRRAIVQRYFDEMRRRAPHVSIEKSRAVAKAAEECGVSESFIWKKLKADKLHIPPRKR